MKHSSILIELIEDKVGKRGILRASLSGKPHQENEEIHADIPRASACGKR